MKLRHATGGLAGEAFAALQAHTARRVKAFCEDSRVSMRELSVRVGYSHPTAGNYVRYPETMSADFMADLARAYPAAFGGLKAALIRALSADLGIKPPDAALESKAALELVRRLRAARDILDNAIEAAGQVQR
jgi:hypothetical protein